MAMKPRDNRPAQSNDSERTEYVHIIPEEGLTPVQIGLLVDLGNHKKYPKYAKDNAGNREKDDDGVTDKVLWPKEGALEQKIAVYVDLLNQTHNYGDEIGEKNIRLPLHTNVRGMAEGLNFTTVAPRDANKQYVKGIPWILASTSNFYKIAGVIKEGDKKVSEIIFHADYKNKNLNDITYLLGKPFMFNVDVKITYEGEGEDKKPKYVNTKLKSPVPLMKGMAVDKPLQASVSVNFDDEDLLEVKDELGGICKFDLVPVAAKRKIVLAEDYPGSKMQEAMQEKEDEAELIKKAKEIQEKILDTDKDLIEIRSLYPDGKPEDGSEAPKPQADVVKAAKPEKPKAPVLSDDDMDDAPF